MILAQRLIESPEFSLVLVCLAHIAWTPKLPTRYHLSAPPTNPVFSTEVRDNSSSPIQKLTWTRVRFAIAIFGMMTLAPSWVVSRAPGCEHTLTAASKLLLGCIDCLAGWLARQNRK